MLEYLEIDPEEEQKGKTMHTPLVQHSGSRGGRIY